jgi:dephospho-CoA kinase
MSVQRVNTKPYLIGLTGGIASGKTTASRIFRECGLTVIDSDDIVKDLKSLNQHLGIRWMR